MNKKAEQAATEEAELKREEKLHIAAVKLDEKALSGERSKFSELVVARHYHFVGKDGDFVGELVGVEKGGQCAVEYLVRGQIRGTREVNFKDYDVREISRAQAHDLSRV